jgi:hypothetical protein
VTVTTLFPIHELVMLALFVAGLVWLIGELALKDRKSLGSMFTNTEAFARAPTERSGFRVLRLRPARMLERLQTKLATVRAARRS